MRPLGAPSPPASGVGQQALHIERQTVIKVVLQAISTARSGGNAVPVVQGGTAVGRALDCLVPERHQVEVILSAAAKAEIARLEAMRTDGLRAIVEG